MDRLTHQTWRPNPSASGSDRDHSRIVVCVTIACHRWLGDVPGPDGAMRKESNR